MALGLRSRKILVIVFLALFFCGAKSLQARPKIGLALSGGGARGLSHIGVLKVLEENKVPIDYIAGTSMGAIVGGLYAIGLSPTEIETAVQEMDWQDLFSDRPNRKEFSFRRKQDDRSDFLNIESGFLAGKIQLPRFFIAGQKFAFAFDVPALHTAGIDGFDDLRVPFRAVATDLRSGKPVVLSSGSLMRALRASMSVPGVFPPVEIKGKLLVDGSLVRNLPVDVVRDMGADVVIAIDVIEELSGDTQGEFNSLLKLSFQLINVAMRANTLSVVDGATLVLRPSLTDVSFVDFSKQSSAIHSGEEVARSHADELQKYSLTTSQYERLISRQRNKLQFEAHVDSVVIDNQSRLSLDTVLRMIHVRAGENVDLRQLQEDLSRLYGLGILELADFEFEHSNTKKRVLRIHLREKSYSPGMIRVGWVFNSDVQGNTSTQGHLRFTFQEMNRFGGEWRNDFSVGNTLSVGSEWYQPLHSARTIFFAPTISYRKAFQGIYSGRSQVATLRVLNAKLAVDLGVQWSRLVEFRTGLFWRHVNADINVPATGFTSRNAVEAAWRSQVELDWIDTPDFPKNGSAAHLDVTLVRRALGSEKSYNLVRGDYVGFKTKGKHTFAVMLSGGGNLNSKLPGDQQFRLGGFNSFSGFEEDELRGSLFGVARLSYYRPLTRELDAVGTQVYGAAWVEGGDVWRDRRGAQLNTLEWSWTLALAAKTLAGPIYLAYGHNLKGGDSIFLTLGRQLGLPTRAAGSSW